ncbi:hypothetical protein WT25_20270 [Burkholderia territorii]|uniref:TonB-dependent siderophore receptor n=1 Tax=Burkholderia territorii TaxID=1503055 RepID=UPI000759B578|nr:TonB-dependent receptor [Burkholderia territorii]KVT78871.1 hypothetical protein WT25_20270 [Burkholderia territorii]
MLSVALGTVCVQAHAQQASVNLPAQPLARSLIALAHAHGVTILMQDALVANRQAPALSGKFTVREALDRLLEGSGLSAQPQAEGTYVIRAVPSSPPPLLPEAAVASGPDAVLPTLTVIGGAERASTGFVADTTSTATRTDTPISETPQSIQVITQDLIKSQQAQSVSEALRNVAGVTVTMSDAGKPPGVSIRGFQAKTMSNGANDASGVINSLNVPMAGVDRIEVLKGADSILSGAMDPGGVVNVVAKRPQAEPVRELTLQTGSYGDWLGAVDLAGALTQDKRLAYRFVLSAERAGQSFGGYEGGKNVYVAPALGWKSGGTDLVVGYQHQVQDSPPVLTTLLGPGGPLPVTGPATPRNGNSLTQSDTVYVDLKQRLGSVFQFESKTQYQRSASKTNGDFFALVGGTPDAAEYLAQAGVLHNYGLSTDDHLQAKFSIGPVRQTMLGGFNYAVSWGDQAQSWMSRTGPFPAPNLQPADGPLHYTDMGKSYSDTVYLQDQLTWQRLHVLASIAHGSAWGSTTPSQSAWTPNVGVLYDLTDNVSVYANAFRSFNPQTNFRLQDGSFAPPKTGRSVEAGFKFNFFDDRLQGTADVFRTAVMNQAVRPPGADYSMLEGGQVTRGVELHVAGRVLPGLNLTADYSWSEELEADALFGLVPRHSGSLWLTYDLQGEHWAGWGGGIGVQARSAVRFPGQDARVPGQMQTDLNVHYTVRRWSAELGIKNLFNRTLYQNFAVSGIAYLQPGRLVYLTGRYNF